MLRRLLEPKLDAAIGMMDQPVIDTAPRADRHFQRVQSQIGAKMISDLPPYNPAREQVLHERGIGPSGSGAHIRDIRDPAAVRRVRGEVPLQQVTRPSAPGTVVRGRLRAAHAPDKPSSRISRSTVHRATSTPSRFSCLHTFRAP